MCSSDNPTTRLMTKSPTSGPRLDVGRTLAESSGRLDPEAYLRDLFRVLAHRPRDRYLELAPKYWAQTRARLDPAQLAIEIGLLDVPPPLTPPADEQVPANHPA